MNIGGDTSIQRIALLSQLDGTGVKDDITFT